MVLPYIGRCVRPFSALDPMRTLLCAMSGLERDWSACLTLFLKLWDGPVLTFWVFDSSWCWATFLWHYWLSKLIRIYLFISLNLIHLSDIPVWLVVNTWTIKSLLFIYTLKDILVELSGSPCNVMFLFQLRSRMFRPSGSAARGVRFDDWECSWFNFVYCCNKWIG